MKRDKTKSFDRQGRFTFTNGSLTIRSKSKEELDELYISHCIDLKNTFKLAKSKEKDRNKILKRCEVCKDFINKNKYIYCHYCQDAYHSYCCTQSSIQLNADCFMCAKCVEENKKKFKQLTVDSLFLNKKRMKETIELPQCFKCKDDIEDDNEKAITCEKCHLIFHKTCFDQSNNKSGSKIVKIICSDCEMKIINVVKTTKISDYFTQTKTIKNTTIKDKKKIGDGEVELLEKISKEIFIKKPNQNEGHFKLPKPLSQTRKDLVMKSLFRALTVKGITFNDDLVFLDPDCPKEMNNAYHEPMIIKISDYNKKIYYAFKEKSRKGEYAPVEVIDDPIQRFIVRAFDDIPMNTIITEYTGEVTLLRKIIFDSNDSIMELIRTPSSSLSIVICPEQYGNLGRFISGINNQDKKLKRKQNVYSLRYNIDGSVHILLLAMRYIKQGEILYYDYNAGGFDEYPTDHFI